MTRRPDPSGSPEGPPPSDRPDWHPRLVRGRPPSLGGAPLFLNRVRSGLSPTARLALHVHREDLFRRLDALDRSMVAAAEERLDLLHQLELTRDQLWPAIPWQRARRPPAVDRSPLPPTTERAIPLVGQPLRQACLAILARHGELPLVEVHAWLHRYGYLVGSAHPVKALADALGHEHDAGRAERTARGVYRLDRRGWRDRRSPEDVLGRPPRRERRVGPASRAGSAVPASPDRPTTSRTRATIRPWSWTRSPTRRSTRGPTGTTPTEPAAPT